VGRHPVNFTPLADNFDQNPITIISANVHAVAMHLINSRKRDARKISFLKNILKKVA
jgi:hypothetical protein